MQVIAITATSRALLPPPGSYRAVLRKPFGLGEVLRLVAERQQPKKTAVNPAAHQTFFGGDGRDAGVVSRWGAAPLSPAGPPCGWAFARFRIENWDYTSPPPDRPAAGGLPVGLRVAPQCRQARATRARAG